MQESCDLGENTNLMIFFVFNNIGLGKIRGGITTSGAYPSPLRSVHQNHKISSCWWHSYVKWDFQKDWRKNKDGFFAYLSMNTITCSFLTLIPLFTSPLKDIWCILFLINLDSLENLGLPGLGNSWEGKSYLGWQHNTFW